MELSKVLTGTVTGFVQAEVTKNNIASGNIISFLLAYSVPNFVLAGYAFYRKNQPLLIFALTSAIINIVLIQIEINKQSGK